MGIAGSGGGSSRPQLTPAGQATRQRRVMAVERDWIQDGKDSLGGQDWTPGPRTRRRLRHLARLGRRLQQARLSAALLRRYIPARRSAHREGCSPQENARSGSRVRFERVQADVGNSVFAVSRRPSALALLESSCLRREWRLAGEPEVAEDPAHDETVLVRLRCEKRSGGQVPRAPESDVTSIPRRLKFASDRGARVIRSFLRHDTIGEAQREQDQRGRFMRERVSSPLNAEQVRSAGRDPCRLRCLARVRGMARPPSLDRNDDPSRLRFSRSIAVDRGRVHAPLGPLRRASLEHHAARRRPERGSRFCRRRERRRLG